MSEPVKDLQLWVETCTPQVAQSIMDRLLERGSVEALCRDDDMPSERQFRRLLVVNQYFRDLYRETGAALRLLWAMEVVTIADGGRGPDPELGYAAADSKNRIARDQLRVSSRLRLLDALDLKTRPSRSSEPGKERTPVEGEVTDDAPAAEDSQHIRHRLAKWLEEQKERMGSDSFTALIMDLTASPAGPVPIPAAEEADDEAEAEEDTADG